MKMDLGNRPLAAQPFERCGLMRKAVRIFLLIAMLQSLGVCFAKSEPEEQGAPVVIYETEKSGPLSQDYRLTIFASGFVIYDGYAKVKSIGRSTFNIASEDVQTTCRSGSARYRFVPTGPGNCKRNAPYQCTTRDQHRGVVEVVGLQLER
jgi:hypothetical protein